MKNLKLKYIICIRLSQQEKKPTQITTEQSVKLANYLLSRRSVQTAKGGALLLEAITYLANDKVNITIFSQFLFNFAHSTKKIFISSPFLQSASL